MVASIDRPAGRFITIPHAPPQKIMRMRIPSLIFTVALLVGLPPAHGQIVFSNDFETGTSGFVASGSLTWLTRVSLPTDSVGMGSSNQSMWLGKLGDGVAKSGSSDEIVTLSLSGLTAGNLHSVSFDLLIGGSWDGAVGGYGPDSWRFTVDGTRLVDTIFSDWTGSNFGAYSPQRYTDTSYTSPSGPDVAGFTGSDAHWTANARELRQRLRDLLFWPRSGQPRADLHSERHDDLAGVRPLRCHDRQ